MRRGWLRAICAVAVAACALSPSAGAAARSRPWTVVVGGTVSAPMGYSPAELRALPQTTVTAPGRRSRTVTGVSLEALVNASHPVLPSAKNALLRVTVTVSGAGRVTLALGELDQNFGDHPAVLALDEAGAPLLAGPELVIPGDVNDSRSVRLVRRITVAVQNPAAVIPAPGDLEIEHDGRTTVLSAAVLAALPAETLSVAFFGPRGLQHHTETGPTLQTVLAAAQIWPDADTFVAAVGSDGYVAAVTPAEVTVGGRPLLIATSQDGVALARPRLVTDGDVKGGRYVSDLVDLAVGEGDRPLAPCALAALGCRILR